MRTLISVPLVLIATGAYARDEPAQAARFNSESMLCATFYARTASASEPGSDLTKTAERNAQLFL